MLTFEDLIVIIITIIIIVSISLTIYNLLPNSNSIDNTKEIQEIKSKLIIVNDFLDRFVLGYPSDQNSTIDADIFLSD